MKYIYHIYAFKHEGQVTKHFDALCVTDGMLIADEHLQAVREDVAEKLGYGRGENLTIGSCTFLHAVEE